MLTAAILLGTVNAILETEPLLAQPYQAMFAAVEFWLGSVFAAEYLARLWSIVEERPPGETAFGRRLRFIASPAAVVDLVAVLVTLVPFFGINVMALRLVRLLRILRLGKLGRMSAALTLLVNVIKSRRYELFVTLALAATVLIFGASALYWVEGDLQPDKFGSIPRSLWWAVITLTTIGYGDVYPITAVGKMIAGVVAIAGIGLIAMPTGILASAFSEAVRNR
ncbi:potassium channel family protein [Lysobacter sp. M2-1]|uniref:potassium channel family protein n=1 Tax=Lysobacter sp. M2-1 TaxID=2916839 RepID=UPI001F5AED02|nr:potassium channel family protein [Lysobacter sp. M2-1]